MKNTLWIILIFLIAFAPRQAAAEETELRIGITQYPSTLHPMIDAMLAKTYVNAMVRRPLTIHNADWQPVCMLCTEIPSFENGRAERVILPDGDETVQARYTIDPQAVWADGVPVTADDVVFSWNVGRNEMVGTSNFELYSKDIINVEKIDEKNFVVTFEKEKCDFALISDFNILPRRSNRISLKKTLLNIKTPTVSTARPQQRACSMVPMFWPRSHPVRGLY